MKYFFKKIAHFSIMSSTTIIIPGSLTEAHRPTFSLGFLPLKNTSTAVASTPELRKLVNLLGNFFFVHVYYDV